MSHSHTSAFRKSISNQELTRKLQQKTRRAIKTVKTSRRKAISFHAKTFLKKSAQSTQLTKNGTPQLGRKIAQKSQGKNQCLCLGLSDAIAVDECTMREFQISSTRKACESALGPPAYLLRRLRLNVTVTTIQDNHTFRTRSVAGNTLSLFVHSSFRTVSQTISIVLQHCTGTFRYTHGAIG